MEYDQTQIRLALQYAEAAAFTADLDPATGLLRFHRSPLPEGLSRELAEEVEFVADYFQRQIFQGDLDPEPDEVPPGWPEFENALAEINYKLERFKPEFLLELKKTLGVNDHRQMNPYAREMLKFSVETQRKKKKP